MLKEEALLMMMQEAGIEVLESITPEVGMNLGGVCVSVNTQDNSVRIFSNNDSMSVLMWPKADTRFGFSGDPEALFNRVPHRNKSKYVPPPPEDVEPIQQTRYVTLEAAIPILKRMLS